MGAFAALKRTMHLVCFDIDGTLVASAGFDGVLYEEAIREVLGIKLKADVSQYRNVSDSGILAEILESVPEAESRARLAKAVQVYFTDRTKQFVAANPNLVREVPGAVQLVNVLRKKPNVQVCIATGGWAETAILKLRAIGLEMDGLAIATSSDAMNRAEIIRLAESRATQARQFTQRTYFGDGVWDKKAAAQLGYHFVAVGGAVQHNVVFSDLRDTRAILAQLGV